MFQLSTRAPEKTNDDFQFPFYIIDLELSLRKRAREEVFKVLLIFGQMLRSWKRDVILIEFLRNDTENFKILGNKEGNFLLQNQFVGIQLQI